VTALADFILRQEGASQREVSILFTDDTGISHLNATHLGRSGPTDVLAFPMNAPGETPLHPEILGDVAVSAERAVLYAKERELDPQRELSLYLIHGLLHLLGYDDMDRNLTRLMRQREKYLLAQAAQHQLLIKIECTSDEQ
jgi:probable rRNA maturation factor